MLVADGGDVGELAARDDDGVPIRGEPLARDADGVGVTVDAEEPAARL